MIGAVGVPVPEVGEEGRKVDVEAKREERVALERRYGRLEMEEDIEAAEGEEARL